MHRKIARCFLIFCLFVLLPAVKAQQVEITIEQEDLSITPEETAFLRITATPATFHFFQVYQGPTGDASVPLPGMIHTGAEVIYRTPTLLETTLFWFRLCNDFGCDDSRTIAITVESDETDPLGDALGETVDLGEGWMRSDWLDDFNTGFFPWIFHAQHGWTFVSEESAPDSVFLFDLSTEGWFFTSSAIYPNLFNFGRNSWVFYFEGTAGPRQFVDLQSGEFFQSE